MAGIDELIALLAQGQAGQAGQTGRRTEPLAASGRLLPGQQGPTIPPVGPLPWERQQLRAGVDGVRPPRMEPLQATRTPVRSTPLQATLGPTFGPTRADIPPAPPSPGPIYGPPSPGGVPAASSLDDLAMSLGDDATRAGGIKGLMNMLPKTMPGKFLNTGLGKGAAGLGIGLAGNLLGDMAGGSGSPLGRFFQGAGTGGGLGMLAGPQGAIIGGLLGGGANMLLGGGEQADPTEDAKNRLDQTLARAEFSDEDREYLNLLYEVNLASTGDPQAALAATGQAMIERLDNREAQKMQQQQMLEMQAVTSEYFKPFTKSIIDSARQRAGIVERLADDLPKEYRSIMMADSAASLDNATKVASAYATQAQLIPVFATMQEQQGMLDQAAQTLYSQGLSNAALGMQGGGGLGAGGGSLTDLIAQMQGQGR